MYENHIYRSTSKRVLCSIYFIIKRGKPVMRCGVDEADYWLRDKDHL